ncbi:hypothetical protein ACWC2K_31290 [Streptomyces chattanoogensis]
MQNRQGKGQTWFPDMTATSAVVTYIVTIRHTDPRPVSERKAARLLRKIREDATLGELIQVTRRVALVDHPACPWCGARPQLMDWDCDGLYYTATCGSPQCGGTVSA